MALLEGLERHADHLAIFCEAGRIQARPTGESRLCTLLEKMIVEVSGPNGGAFHPKIWVLRYRPVSKGEPPRMRVLVLSRNLTRDQSWDLSLCVDGVITEQQRGDNQPLVDLLRTLPAMVKRPPSAHVQGLVERLARDLNHTRWNRPRDWRSLSFAVNGIGRGNWFPARCARLGIVAPFCDGGALVRLARLPSDGQPILVSRPVGLAAVHRNVFGRFKRVYVMDEACETEDGDDLEADEQPSFSETGLHAKVFLQEKGHRTVITMGSGNATTPALISGKNVEVFATISAPKRVFGTVNQILGQEGFGRLLREFHPDEIEPVDSETRDAEERVETARRMLATGPPALHCDELLSDGHPSRWRLTLDAGQPVDLDGIRNATAWPITMGESHSRDVLTALKAGDCCELAILSLVDITRFIAIRLEDRTGKASVLFTLGLQLTGTPDNRSQAVLRSVVDSRDAFLRYLRLLLVGQGDPLGAWTAASAAKGGSTRGRGVDQESILEDMVGALFRGRDRLDAVRRLVRRLEEAPDSGDSVIPEEFVELWNSFRSVLGSEGLDHV